jgi:sugar phosphate isomerase/epimerase
MSTRVTRRALLAGGAALSQLRAADAATAAAAETPADPADAARRLKVAIFSKHLQFLAGEELAAAAANIGFDAIDITVRKGGHVAPERVREDLPPLVKIIRAHGLETPMITTDIVDSETPHTQAILETASKLGIFHYRWGGLVYDPAKSYPAQLDAMKPRIARLAALNARYGCGAMYHTHSGRNVVGAPIWDLYVLLKDFDPRAAGVNYDVGHATIEGGIGGWIDSFRITGPHLRGIAVKDFVWAKDAQGAWKEKWTPIGEGMVHFDEFFGMVKGAAFDGPLQIHFEYPLNGSHEETYAAMKRDLRALRAYMAKAGV